MQDPLNPTADYTVPKGDSKYLKFEEGSTEFFPVASALIGWEYWDTNDKPVRLAEKPEGNPMELPNIRADRYGNYKVSHFWLFPVIDCLTGKVKILEITQGTVQTGIRNYVSNPRWGSPVMKYTLTVNRDESGSITKYTVMANPLSEIPKEWLAEWERVQKAGFNIAEIFTNGDPFNPTTKATPSVADRQFEGSESVLPEYPEDTAVPPDEEEVIVA